MRSFLPEGRIGTRGGITPRKTTTRTEKSSSRFLKNNVTFITFCSRLDCMNDITSSKKMENGIVVFWEEQGSSKFESFNYSELIDMKINALDLLEHPKYYKVDGNAHKIVARY
jgi:hypothetical protein